MIKSSDDNGEMSVLKDAPRGVSTGSENGFEPEITAFTCIYCGAMARDSAGAKRITYPANVKVLRRPVPAS